MMIHFPFYLIIRLTFCMSFAHSSLRDRKQRETNNGKWITLVSSMSSISCLCSLPKGRDSGTTRDEWGRHGDSDGDSMAIPKISKKVLTISYYFNLLSPWNLYSSLSLSTHLSTHPGSDRGWRWVMREIGGEDSDWAWCVRTETRMSALSITIFPGPPCTLQTRRGWGKSKWMRKKRLWRGKRRLSWVTHAVPPQSLLLTVTLAPWSLLLRSFLRFGALR